MTEKFVQTVSSVNYNKGVFSLYFVGQDQKNMANGVMAESDNDLELKQVCPYACLWFYVYGIDD